MNMIKRELPSIAIEEEKVRNEIRKFKKLMDFIPDYENKEECIRLAKESKKLFTAIEKTRKIVKKPVIDEGREIDALSNTLKSEIEEVAKPFWDFKKKVETEEKRKKELFEEMLQKKIDYILNSTDDMMQCEIAEIEERLSEIESMDLLESMYHRTDDALKAREETIGKLKTLLDGKKSAIELERLKKEIKERENKEVETIKEKEVMPWENKVPLEHKVKSMSEKVADWLDEVNIEEEKKQELVNILASGGILVKRNEIKISVDELPY